MKITLIALLFFIYTTTAMGLEAGVEIQGDSHTTIYKNTAVRITGGKYTKPEVIIEAISTQSKKNPVDFSEVIKPFHKIVDKTLWTITTDQLPFTIQDCYDLGLIVCEEDTKFCYKNCLVRSEPQIVAYDEKNKKIYLSYGTYDIGTGGGPAMLFVADINKREIKFLKLIDWEVSGSLSPSMRYLVLDGASVVRIYDTKNKTWFDMNESENDYTGKNFRYIFHGLNLKKWISDTQFIYLDEAYYFSGMAFPKPFISAKEVVYDISAKNRIREKNISQKEYNEFIKHI